MENTGNWASRNRPETLDEFCGQQTAKAKIRGLLKDKKVPGLIGITGQTGEGKTTIARLLANNLTKFPKHDVIERDMGSNGSIDDIRELARISRYSPKGRYRIFIIDEFHLVSKQAASVLLKLMEEPPPKTIFIWCTDQPEKVLPSLRGRSFMIRLESQNPEEIVPFMELVCKREGFKFKTKQQKQRVLSHIAQLSNGQPRAAINTLEELYKTVKGKGSVKDAIETAVKELDEVSPDLAATKFVLMIYFNKPKSALACMADFKGQDWKQLVDSIIFLNTYVFQRVCGQPSGCWGSRKTLATKFKEKKLDFKDVPLTKPIAFQNYLVDILKEYGSFMVSPHIQVPARLAAIVAKVCK